MSLPNVTVEFSPGSGPYDTPSWVDISSRVLSIQWGWGRQDELDRFDPGQAIIALKNNDRLFDPENTAGTYFGDLVPRVPFRIRSTTGTKDLFYGFVQDGWEQEYLPPADSVCTVKLVDLKSVIDGEVLPSSAYEATILASSPSAYWKLDETSGNQMLDSSGNGNHGVYHNGDLGEESLIVNGEGHSVFLPHVGDNRGEYRGGSLPTGPPCTLEAWVKFERDLAASHVIMAVQRDSALSSLMYITVSAGGISPNGELAVRFVNLGGSYQARGHTSIDDNRPHHVAMTMGSTNSALIKLYVDGVEQTKTLIAGTTGGSWPGHLWWTIGNFTDSGAGDFGIDGLIDECAVYPSELSAATVLDHYNAGATAFTGEAVGDRIDRVLDIIGVPAGMRDIATGDTFAGPADYRGRAAGEYIDMLVESEQGYLYVDHANGGKLTFKGRYSRFTDTRSITSQATFTDAPAASPAYRYERDGLRIEPNGISSVVNRVEVSWPGGTEVVESDTDPPWGPQSRTITTEAPSPVAARSAGLWMITRFSDPQTRLRELTINPGAAVALQTPALDLRVGDRVTVVRTPQNSGNTITNVVIIEGVDHSVQRGLSWQTTYSLSDADTSAVWIWGTSTWGGTKVWG